MGGGLSARSVPEALLPGHPKLAAALRRTGVTGLRRRCLRLRLLGRQRALRLDADGKILIDFAGGAVRRAGQGLRERRPSTFPYFDYAAVLDGRVPSSVLKTTR